jgi:hypothetical protein
MEGAMNERMKKQYREIDYDLQRQLAAKRTPDATGLWFAAAVLCAFLTAGVIVYRTGNSDMVTAANEPMPAAAKTGPIDAPPILPIR